MLLKLLPWWLFGLVALAMLSLSFDAGRDYLASRAMLTAAQQSTAPPPVAIAAFDAATDVAVLEEVRLRGIWLSDLGVGAIPKKKVDDGYVVVKDATETAYAVLYFPGYKADGVEADLRALIAADGTVTVAGFRKSSSLTAEAVTKDLIARGLAAGPPVLVVEPYFGDRGVALAGRVSDDLLGFASAAGINLIFAIIAVVKFRAWRSRVAVRAAPSVAGLPRVNARTAALARATPGKPAIGGSASAKPATPPRDGFSSGPIQSRKGWFR